MHLTPWRFGVITGGGSSSGSRIVPGDNLEKENSNGESVNLVGVARLRTKGLWWHVDQCSWTLGHFTASHGGIGGCCDLGHGKVSHLCLVAVIKKNVVAGQVSMENAIPVQVSHC